MTARQWNPPDSWLCIRTVDAHTAGEPLRVIVGGFPEPQGDTILQRRRYAREHLDRLRTALMWEPRGHADMYGALPVPPERAGSDLGVLFLHNEGYSSMCGHGIIGLVVVALETGMLAVSEPETSVRIDTPAGLVQAWAELQQGQVRRVRFLNVPSFVSELDAHVQVPGLGSVHYDLAYGGAFYAFVDAAPLGVELVPERFQALIRTGMDIKRAIVQQRRIEHPHEPDLGSLYGTIFTGPAADPAHHSRNVCIFADGELDRSPTGTGVSARAAIHHARGELSVGERIVIESLIGTTFEVRVAETAQFGPYAAVVPEVTGEAFITGRNEWLIDPHDPLREGFLLR